MGIIILFISSGYHYDMCCNYFISYLINRHTYTINLQHYLLRLILSRVNFHFDCFLILTIYHNSSTDHLPTIDIYNWLDRIDDEQEFESLLIRIIKLIVLRLGSRKGTEFCRNSQSQWYSQDSDNNYRADNRWGILQSCAQWSQSSARVCDI